MRWGSGVGTAALQLAKGREAICLGTAGSDFKLLKTKDLGLDTAINCHQDDFLEIVMAEAQRQGVDAILDLVGGSYWEKNLACLAPRGAPPSGGAGRWVQSSDRFKGDSGKKAASFRERFCVPDRLKKKSS